MTEVERFRDWLRGNEDAVQMIVSLGRISQLWDDLVDQDTPVTPERAHAAFRDAMIYLPRNPFYRTYFEELQPVIEMAILDWMTANSLEATKDRHNLSVAYVLRDSLAGVLIRAMSIVGGVLYAAERAPEVRAAIHDEPLEGYIEERRHG